MISAPKKRGRPQKIVTQKDSPYYLLTLEIMGKYYLGDGYNMVEALQNLEKPLKVVTKGTLTIRVDKKERKMLLSVIAIKQLFYPLSTIVRAKQLEYGLK